jgi:PAS domain S-box-containing protein
VPLSRSKNCANWNTTTMKTSLRTEPNHRILVIDDIRAIHDDIRKVLAGNTLDLSDLDSDEALLFNHTPKAGVSFEIDSAYQGQEGLSLLERSIAEERPYAMAFVDVRMPPGWNGVETIERLWRVCPDLQVVICTAHSDHSWTDIHTRLGNSENLLILKKPFDNVEVMQLACSLTSKWLANQKASARMEDLDRMVAHRTVELQRAHDAFREVFVESPIGIMLSDMDGRCLDVNRACEEMFGAPKCRIVGNDPVELGWIESRASIEAFIQKLRTLGCVDAAEIEYYDPSSGLRTGLVWLREITIHDSRHILWFCLDITDRKRMEGDLMRARTAAEDAGRAKSAFLANMSHEIRTPLNGVVCLSALLDEEKVPDDTRSMLRLIRASGETLAKILDDVLDFSKIECGKLELEEVPFSVREALEWGVELYRTKAAEKHLSLTLNVDREIPDQLVGDATRIRQVVGNLISNAVKFTAEGSIDISAEPAIEHSLDGTFRTRVTVRDTGIGIPPDKIGKLFQSFSQVDATTSRRFGGSGLGLAICRRLVEMMGGAIHVDSRPGEGSTFTFDFEARTPAPAESMPARAADSELEPMRILVAEDNPVNQIVMRRVLQRLGCSVDLVPDGEGAIRQVQECQYDLLLMDLHMPGIDGREATRRIRFLQQGRAAIPIIALTASATIEDREACLAAGMNDFVVKPLVPDVLRSALRRWGPGNVVVRRSSD